MVWVQTDQIFPLQGIEKVEGQSLSGTFSFDLFAWTLVGVFVLGWIAFAVRFRDDPRARTVVVAGLALAIPAAYAWEKNLALRQFVPLAVISCIALGTVAGALINPALTRRGWTGAVMGAASIAVLVAVFSQLHLEPSPRRENVVTPLADLLRPQLSPGAIGVTNRRAARQQLAYELYGDAEVALLQLDGSPSPPDLADFLWLNKFNDRFIGVRRSDLAELITMPSVRFLAFIGPHRTAAPELVASLATAPGLDGITLVKEILDGSQYAVAFAIDPERVARSLDEFPLQISSRTAEFWLDRQADLTSEASARERFVQADPTVHGPPADRAALAKRIGSGSP